ncbi:MAG: PH domain-containing protein [Polyangiaceae bacterium]
MSEVERETTIEQVTIGVRSLEGSRRSGERFGPLGLYASTLLFVAGGALAVPLLWAAAGGLLLAGLFELAAGNQSDDQAWDVEPGSLSVRGGELVVTRGSRPPLTSAISDVESGWIDDEGRCVLRLRSGVEIAATLPRERGEQLLAQLGVAPGGRVAAVPTASAWSRFASFMGGITSPAGSSLFGAIASVALPLMISLFGLGAGVAASEFFHQGNLASGVMSPIIASLVLFAQFAFARARRRREVRVGNDGVFVRGTFERRFIPWSEITRVRKTEEGGVELGLADRGTLELAPAPGGAMLASRLQAWRDARVAPETGAATEVLDRGSKSKDAWRVHLENLAVPGDDYRSARLEEDALASVVSDPEAPVDRRVGAAVVLSRMGDAAKDRVRVAVRGCADTSVKAMLERAAEGEIEEAELEAAERRARR